MQHSALPSEAGFYDAKVLGAPFKVLLSGGVSHETNVVTGKVYTEIEDLPGLIAAVVEARIFSSRKLASADLKFIRSALALKSSELAVHLHFTPEHYSRIENGSRIMPPDTEKMYRLSVFFLMGSRSLEIAEAAAKIPAAERTQENAANAYKRIREMFLNLKIDPVRGVNDDLVFQFSRRCRSEHDSPCEDGDWEPQAKAAA